ncbi:hypothetical protein ACPZ19_03330 [Amycolatopsis lurida]
MPNKGRIVASLVFVGCLGLLGVLAAFGFVAAGLAGGLRYSLVFAVMMFLTTAFGYVFQLGSRHRVASIVSHDDGAAVELRGSKLVFALLTGIFACLTLFFGMASADYLRAGPDVPAKQIPAALCAVAALYFGGFLVLVAIGRVRRGGVVLSPRGIHQRGWTFSSFLPWDAVVAGKAATFRGAPCVLVVASANARWDRRQHARLWKVDKLPPTPMIAINCAAFAIDRALLYHFVQFYIDHPAARAELGTERGLRRARSGDPR